MAKLLIYNIEKLEDKPNCRVQAVDMWFLGLLLPYFMGTYRVYSPEHAAFWSQMSKQSRSRKEAVAAMEEHQLEGMDDDVIDLLSKVLCKAEERMTISQYIEAYDEWLAKRES